MAVKLITFKTNHTIIGSIIDDTGEYITVREPVQVVMVPPRSQNDPGGIAFSPFLEYCNEFKTGIKIDKSNVLVITTPVVDLENQYNQVFGSGIQIASKLI